MKTEQTVKTIQNRNTPAKPEQAQTQSSGKQGPSEAETRWRRLAALTREAYFETDLDGRFLFFTDALCNIFKRASTEIESALFSSFFPEDDKKKISRTFKKILKNQKPSSEFVVAIHLPDEFKKRKGILVGITLDLIKDSNHQPTGFSGIARDVTKKMAAKTALKESEDKYQNILDAAPYAISIFSATDGRYIQVSKGFCLYTGYREKEIIGKTARQLDLHLSDEDEKKVTHLLRKNKKLDDLKMSYRTKNGDILDTLTSSRPIQFKGKSCYLSIAIDITPIKKAQKELKASQERYRAILDAALDPISLTRMSDGKYVEANSAFYQRAGLTSKDVIGRTSSDINLYADPSDRKRLIDKIKKSGRVDGIEMPVHLKDGSIATDLWSCRVVEFDNEDHLVVVAKDISELKKSRQALKDSEESYRAILETAPFSVSLTRLSDMTYIQVNDSFSRRTGYAREEVIGHSTVELGLYKNMEDRKRLLGAFRQNGVIDSMEIQFRTKSGGYTDSLISGKKVRFRGEDCLLTISADITELKAAQRAAEERGKSYRAILEAAPYSIVVTRASDSKYMQVNEAFCKRTGFSREEAIGRTPQELGIFVDPDTQKRIREIFFKKGQVVGMEVEFKGKDGRILDNLYSSTPITYNGESCVLSITVGIEELKKAQNALSESEQKYRNILANIEEGYWEVDLKGSFTFVNDAEARIHRLSPQDLLGKNNRDFSRPEKTKQIFKIFNQIYTTGIPVTMLDYEILRSDGTVASVELSASLLKNATGEPIGFFGISRDITQKKLAEKELEKYRHHLEEMVSERTRELETAQAELVKKGKLAVLGQLTATVSHELRNPLGVIRSSNFYLQRKVKHHDKKISKHFNRIEDQVALCDTIVADLLEYTRGRNVSVAVNDLTPWIEALLDQEEEGEDSFPIERDLSPKMPPIAHDQDKMRRVLINLIDNARLAVKDKLDKYTKNQSVYHPRIRVATRLEDDHIIIEVTDNGIGMRKQTQRHAFEPLFTTRARGTGIGLANVEKIITEHSGKIMLDSVPDKGTTITIKLPCPE